MEFLMITLISLGLAMDAFAVSLAIGTSGQISNRRGKLRLAAHFGIFQSGMTALGWLAGSTVVQYVSQIDHWIAFILLAYVGLNLIRSGLNKDKNAFEQDPSTGKILVMLSFATSIDAFAVGLSIALLNIPILLSIIAIGMVALLLSAIGLFAGCCLEAAFGEKMEIVGGLILLGIGIRVLITHLFP
ncbi:MAG: manganese efflux pump MntP family protein [Anaerolineae bacterium]|nr:manganese efflux pump MntP family protein [Anaerolineae bacterium]